MKKLVGLMMVVILTVTIFSTLANIPTNAVEIPIRVVVDNEEVSFPDAQPFIDGNYRTQTPARFIGEALGATVTWDKTLQQAKFVKGSQELLINIGSKTYQLNGRDLEMDTVAIIENDRTFVPARYVAEAFGAEVSWDGAVKTVYVESDSTTIITTGSGEIEYYDGVAFDPVADVNSYGQMEEEKLIEFYENCIYCFRFIVIDGDLYVEGEFPEVPEGFRVKVNMDVYKFEDNPSTYNSGSLGDKTRLLPTEGSFSMKLADSDQNLSENNGYGIEIYIFDSENGKASVMDINTPNTYNDRGYYVEYRRSNLSYYEVFENVDFSKIFIF